MSPQALAWWSRAGPCCRYSPQLARGPVGRVRHAAAVKSKATGLAAGRVVGIDTRAEAAWPAVALMGSYELLAWMIRIAAVSGPDHVPGRTTKYRSRTNLRPSGPPAGSLTREAVPAATAPAGDVDAAAVAAYRVSFREGKPLSERELAEAFGKTSRRCRGHSEQWWSVIPSTRTGRHPPVVRAETLVSTVRRRPPVGTAKRIGAVGCGPGVPDTESAERGCHARSPTTRRHR